MLTSVAILMAKNWSLPPSSLQFSGDMNKMSQGLEGRATVSAWESYERKTQLCPFFFIFSIHEHALFPEQHRKHFNNYIM